MYVQNQILTRRKQPEEYSTAENLTREAFRNLNAPDCDEHYLAHTLRSHADFVPELDFVTVSTGLPVPDRYRNVPFL